MLHIQPYLHLQPNGVVVMTILVGYADTPLDDKVSHKPTLGSMG